MGGQAGEAPVGGRHDFSVTGLQAGLGTWEQRFQMAVCPGLLPAIRGAVRESPTVWEGHAAQACAGGVTASRPWFVSVAVFSSVSGLSGTSQEGPMCKAGSSCTSHLKGTRIVSPTCSRPASGFPGAV